MHDRATGEPAAGKDAGRRVGPGVTVGAKQAILGLQSAAGNAAVTSRLAGRRVVQRNLGAELEDSHWVVADQADQKVDKAVPLVHRDHFQLQAEDNGASESNIEMVTNPPGVPTVQEWKAMSVGMQNLGQELNELPAREKVDTSTLTGGRPGFALIPPKAEPHFNPFLQATVGVPLRAVPSLIRRLNKAGVHVSAADQQVTRSQVRLFAGSRPSRELLGFATMIQSYLASGRGYDNELASNSLLKGMVGLMARTDFASMFALLPEQDQDLISQDLDGWVTTMMQIMVESSEKKQRRSRAEAAAARQRAASGDEKVSENAEKGVRRAKISLRSLMSTLLPRKQRDTGRPDNSKEPLSDAQPAEDRDQMLARMARRPLFNAMISKSNSGIAPRMVTTTRGQWLAAMTEGIDLASAGGKQDWWARYGNSPVRGGPESAEKGTQDEHASDVLATHQNYAVDPAYLANVVPRWKRSGLGTDNGERQWPVPADEGHDPAAEADALAVDVIGQDGRPVQVARDSRAAAYQSLGELKDLFGGLGALAGVTDQTVYTGGGASTERSPKREQAVVLEIRSVPYASSPWALMATIGDAVDLAINASLPPRRTGHAFVLSKEGAALRDAARLAHGQALRWQADNDALAPRDGGDRGSAEQSDEEDERGRQQAD
jgi:hypothetical protein